MKNKRGGFTPEENPISILPSVAAGLVVFAAVIAAHLIYFPPDNAPYKTAVLLLGLLGMIYLSSYYFIYTTSLNKTRFSWGNSFIAILAICAMIYTFPEKLEYLLFTLTLIAALSSSIMSTRGPAYTLIGCVAAFDFSVRYFQGNISHDWVIHFGFSVAALMGVETIQQLKRITTRQINRLELINEISKQVVSTLETRQLYELLNAALQNALEADAYYIGIVDGDQIHFELLYDDGEYYRDLRVNKNGTLSNWVIAHQQELFLPDLRQNIQLEDVQTITVGKDKPTLSWMGVPIRGAHVDGVIAISSYRHNAFDRSDMELLSTIAQRAAFALDNTYHHAFVEKQAQLDSLTNVFNHGHFIQVLREQAKTCLAQNQPLSLIMLDIDHFKQYNDKFGHLIGDEILIQLCNAIRTHIKSTDAVGRWGGEEFAISLPNTDSHQAWQIAERIRATMASLQVKASDEKNIPTPTVSQGIAIFPLETNDTTKLIDLADERLYIAKERGRDQIEPAPASLKSN